MYAIPSCLPTVPTSHASPLSYLPHPISHHTCLSPVMRACLTPPASPPVMPACLSSCPASLPAQPPSCLPASYHLHIFACLLPFSFSYNLVTASLLYRSCQSYIPTYMPTCPSASWLALPALLSACLLICLPKCLHAYLYACLSACLPL